MPIKMGVKAFLAIGTVTFAGAIIYAEDKASLPADVQAYIDRREGCNHWAGEPDYDADRAKMIRAALKDGRCDQLDTDEKRLSKRYRKQPRVVEAIKDAHDALP